MVFLGCEHQHTEFTMNCQSPLIDNFPNTLLWCLKLISLFKSCYSFLYLSHVSMLCLVGFCTQFQKSFLGAYPCSFFQRDIDVQFLISLISHKVLQRCTAKACITLFNQPTCLNKGHLSLIHQFQNRQKLFGQDLKTEGCQGKLWAWPLNWKMCLLAKEFQILAWLAY